MAAGMEGKPSQGRAPVRKSGMLWPCSWRAVPHLLDWEAPRGVAQPWGVLGTIGGRRERGDWPGHEGALSPPPFRGLQSFLAPGPPALTKAGGGESYNWWPCYSPPHSLVPLPSGRILSTTADWFRNIVLPSLDPPLVTAFSWLLGTSGAGRGGAG